MIRLAEHFLARVCSDFDLPTKTFAPDARAALLAYHWLGNVRQLSYVIERAALLSEGSTISVSALGLPD